MFYEEAMNYINKIGRLGSCYGLERTYRLLEILGNPQNDYKIIHIAGTNGKGSITSMVTSLLMEKGFKVGMYTSPYLEEFEERIQINRNNIPKEKLGMLMDEVKKAVDKVLEEGYKHPTEFEIITALMYLYFSKEKVQYAVVEVGLGGRLDSTNVITPILSVIASISYDHTNILGSTLTEIAGEKAGIIKKNVNVVSFIQEDEALKVIKNKAKEMNSKLTVINPNNIKLIRINNEGSFYQEVEVNIEEEKFNVKLPLLGEHQILNLLTALTAYNEICKKENLKFDVKEIQSAISKVKWIGRLEVMQDKPLLVIDGAHNLQGISTLRNNVHKYFKYDKMYLCLGILADKEVDKMIKVITPEATKVYALTPHNNRAESSEALRKEILKYNKNCISVDDYEKALEMALNEASSKDLILISGSLYMIGDMRKIITKHKSK